MPARPHCSGLRSSPSLFACEARSHKGLRPSASQRKLAKHSPRCFATLRKGVAAVQSLTASLLAACGTRYALLYISPKGGAEIRAVAFQDRAPPGPYPSVVAPRGVGEPCSPTKASSFSSLPFGEVGWKITYVTTYIGAHAPI